MDYEKKQRLIALRNRMKEYGYTDGVEELESIFPQLAESEDERIRQEMIEFLNQYKEDGLRGVDITPWISYLEKQKESEINVEDYRLRDTWEYIDEFIKKFGRVPKDIDELSACVDYVIKHKSINEEKQRPVEIHIDNPNIQKVDPDIKITTSDSSASGGELLYVSNKSYEIGYRDGKKEAEQKPAEIDEYEIIKKHITEDSLSGEVNKRLTECGWYVTEQKPVKYISDSAWQKVKSAITDCKKLSEHYEDTEENFYQYYGGKAEGLQLALDYFGNENEQPIEEQKSWIWNNATINGEPIPTENQSVDISLVKWSEEDEALFNLLHICVCRCINDSNLEYQIRERVSREIIPFIERLKYLRPQPHTVSIKNANKFAELEYERGVKDGLNHQWKPSEEQVKALEECGECKRCIKELYKQLKKL